MIARVTLEFALRREFDYLVPPELVGQVDVGTRVQVPLGRARCMGCVTGMAEESAQAQLKAILKVIGAKSLVTPQGARTGAVDRGVLLLRAGSGAQERCCRRPCARRRRAGGSGCSCGRCRSPASCPKLSKRQQEIWNIIEERREMPLTELLELADTTAATVRRLEDRGLVAIAPEISERDPYAREQILPSQPLPLNPAQEKALAEIMAGMDGR